MMKKEITLGQLLSVGVTLLIAIVTGWVTLNNKVSSHDAQIKSLESRQTKIESSIDRFDDKLDKVIDAVTDIKIKMERKKDR